MASDRPRVGFVLEQALGHAAHAKTLGDLLPHQDLVDAVVATVPFDVDGWPARVPAYGNWTVRAGLRAGRAIRSMQRDRPLDALFIHTQVPAVLNARWLRRIPTVVSLDATPLQYDEMGEYYGHRKGHRRVEALKHRATQRCLERAAHVVAWSAWAKRGVVDGYGIAADRVTVVPPSVELNRWGTSGSTRPAGERARILFVGGDFERKGGTALLAAFGQLRAALGERVSLDVVTRSALPEQPGVTVHRDLAPADPGLVACFRDADIFCLPTKADCLAVVLVEAAAAGLPLVSTNVAALTEVVLDGETGLVVDPDQPASIEAALRRLVQDPALRARLGANARTIAERDFDAATNVERLATLLAAVARGEVR